VYSIVECGGFQFKVAEGDTIRVPRLDAAVETEVVLDRVLLTGDGGTIAVGAPYVEGSTVKATVVGHGEGRKVMVMKRKRRKGYRRKNGHRQAYTTLRVVSIAAQ
jgi:large subunit ribosomal protein L21